MNISGARAKEEQMGRFHVYFPSCILELMDKHRKQLGLSRSAYLRMMVLARATDDEKKQLFD